LLELSHVLIDADSEGGIVVIRNASTFNFQQLKDVRIDIIVQSATLSHWTSCYIVLTVF
jgi:hypothetical protein